jgi:hypothetical protein
MLGLANRSSALSGLFKRKRVATLDDLRAALGTRSRTTVFRALTTVGYLSSYNHRGQYYTLRRIPKFDSSGLWHHRTVGFSARGTLVSTVIHLVREARAGQSHEELQERLGLRVHDTLRKLVESKQLARELVGSVYVYLDPTRAAAQLELRRGQLEQSRQPATRELDLRRVIDILVAKIRHPDQDADALVALLRRDGREVMQQDVEQVFERYGLGKKTTSRPSRRSKH